MCCKIDGIYYMEKHLLEKILKHLKLNYGYLLLINFGCWRRGVCLDREKIRNSVDVIEEIARQWMSLLAFGGIFYVTGSSGWWCWTNNEWLLLLVSDYVCCLWRPFEPWAELFIVDLLTFCDWYWFLVLQLLLLNQCLRLWPCHNSGKLWLNIHYRWWWQGCVLFLWRERW